MRTIVHLSDLHFGRVDAALLEPLIALVTRIEPDLVVVSGDLTQRARSVEFEAARRFLDALPAPQIVVPGNHDVPLHNVVERMLRPLAKFQHFITSELAPVYIDGEIAVMGLNTARSMVIKNGRINKKQIATVQAQFCRLDDKVTKIIVSHHPFDLPGGHGKDQLVGRARLAMQTFARCGADLLLAGHFHASHAGSTAARYQIIGHSALVVQAGTATSTRGRGETNSFNVLRIEHPAIVVQRFGWQPEAGEFAIVGVEQFESVAGEWARSIDTAQDLKKTR
jgi:3',5'-cyclic AMP phosphodiesterase CpdA